ncbi:hypothetical protein F511_29106 [Dorcoceras hygrometricum]|uniref:Uncharacterized protein n=1 Tax=Dorcoceras hygrometricum TaxID=472368 RepID=A0A2Z7C9A6_9LAMI|nr:hypothetical protein F511_29106 [Dorcoceras hygrometricum]
MFKENDETSFKSNSAASLHDLCSRLESTSLEESDDDVPHTYSAEGEQPAVVTTHNNIQQDPTGNPVFIDLTNVDQPHDRITSAPTAGGEASKNQDNIQSDDAQPTTGQPAARNFQLVSSPPAGQPVATPSQLASRPPTGEPAARIHQLVSPADQPVASTFHQLESDAQLNNEQIQLASADPVVAIQPTTQGEQGANPIGLDVRWNRNHPPEQVIGNIQSPVRTRVQLSHDHFDAAFLSHIEPKIIDDEFPSFPTVVLGATLSEQFNESQSGISSRLHKIEQGLRDSLREQAEVFKNLFQGARQEGRTIDDVQTLRFNEFRKNILAQNASIFTGLADVRKEVQEDNAKVDIIASRLNDVRKNVEETKEALSHQLLEFQIQALQTLRFNEFRKNILAQNASIFTGLADVRKEVQEDNAKVDIIASRLNDVRKNVEETKEALSHQLLEFQIQAQANQNILHAQLSELVNYINRGSADKKGESSNRGPQQPPNVQNIESGQSISLEETAERIREADRRQAEMERERERQRRIRRLSGSSKRRRGY